MAAKNHIKGRAGLTLCGRTTETRTGRSLSVKMPAAAHKQLATEIGRRANGDTYCARCLRRLLVAQA